MYAWSLHQPSAPRPHSRPGVEAPCAAPLPAVAMLWESFASMSVVLWVRDLVISLLSGIRRWYIYLVYTVFNRSSFKVFTQGGVLGHHPNYHRGVPSIPPPVMTSKLPKFVTTRDGLPGGYSLAGVFNLLWWGVDCAL